MSLIKQIKQYINGSWKDFDIHSDSLNNVVTLDGNEEIITGSKVFSSGSFSSAPKAGTNIAGSSIYVCEKDLNSEGGAYAYISPDSFALTYPTGMPVIYGKEGITWGANIFNFPTSSATGNNTFATQEWVNGVIAGKVDYLGTVASINDLAAVINNATDPTPGDYCRASATFTLLNTTEVIHVGDILIYKSNGEMAENVPSEANWDIIHTEDPGNYVDLTTDAQAISGYKMFNGGLTTSNLGCESFSCGSFVYNNGGGIASFGNRISDNSQPPAIYMYITDGVGTNEYDVNKITRRIASESYTYNFPDATGTLATQEWVKVNAIGSSTIDQEFFNSLY